MPIRSRLASATFNRRWCALRRATSLHAPAPWRGWLTDRGSLTQHLLSASEQQFRVELVSQGWQRPTLSESRALNMDPRQLAVIREVYLIGKDQPWVFARSVIPATTLTGSQRQLLQLGNRSLGTLLFRDPTMRRGPLQISQLPLADGNTAWARRSVFHLSDKPLLVCEVFLPALEQVNYRPHSL